jgi:hypothetical protein
MRTVFEPSNALEGHMLQDLLRQRGIASRVDGAQLQGGVGELPVSGFVRLVVDDSDFDAARAVIDEWESTTTADPIQLPTPRRRVSKAWLGALIGLVVGIAGTYAVLSVPRQADGIDHNGDGSLDERWFVSAAGTLIRGEFDRDFDGSVDLVQRYDRDGRLDTSEADDDFDGRFETKWSYINGNPYYGEIDLDEDSSIDMIFRHRNGVLVSAEYFTPGLDQPVRKELYELNRITTAYVDSNRDGHFDLAHKYSGFSEIVESIPLETPE